MNEALARSATSATDSRGADPRLAALALLLHVANHVLRSVAWRGVLAAAYPEQRAAVPAACLPPTPPGSR